MQNLCSDIPIQIALETVPYQSQLRQFFRRPIGPYEVVVHGSSTVRHVEHCLGLHLPPTQLVSGVREYTRNCEKLSYSTSFSGMQTQWSSLSAAFSCGQSTGSYTRTLLTFAWRSEAGRSCVALADTHLLD